MDYVTYQEIVVRAMGDLYSKALSYVPNLIWAAIVLILGWLLATFLSKIVKQILELIRVDHLANQLGLKNLSDRMDRKLSLTGLGAWLVKWFFILGSFLAAADILGLEAVSNFLYQDVLSYAGQVILAMAVLLLGILAANFFSELVASSVKASGLHNSGLLASITRWAIIISTLFTVLAKLGVDQYLHDLYRAIILMLAIAGGLAFGLGGKEHANKILDKIDQNLK